MIKSHINSIFNSVTYYGDDYVVDPGDYMPGFDSVKSVLLTHAHFDHIYGLNELCCRSSEACVYTNEFGLKSLLSDKLNMSRYHNEPWIFRYPERVIVVCDRQQVLLSHNQYATAYFTPGHNPSCITWIVGNNVFTGDALIPGLKTVTNLPGADKTLAIQSASLINEIARGHNILPGHKMPQ